MNASRHSYLQSSTAGGRMASPRRAAWFGKLWLAGCGFAAVTSFSSSALGQEDGDAGRPAAAAAQGQSNFFVDYFDYEERVYSRSRKTELGEQTDIDAAVRYQYNPDTFARFRIDTDPIENPEDSKTSKFEALAFHRFGALEVQVDADINTKDGDEGGIAIGPDLDSESTFIAYRPADWFAATFYPYNFDGEVGQEFNTWDVTRIHYIDGAPATINEVPLRDESIQAKTIPGLVLSWSPLKELSLYAGAGVASYLYPSNDDFSVDQNVGADSWERRQDKGWKGGLAYDSQHLKFELKHVRHDKSQETGSLLESATAAVVEGRFGGVVLGAEHVTTKAGKAPYRVARETSWFEETAPYQPIYSDYFGNRQDWLGKTDTAWMLLAGYEIGTVMPYIAYKYQGRHFIYREQESAHVLRTADETKSHGGLRTYTLGAIFGFGKFQVEPVAEWMRANNPVFGNSGDVREDPILASYNKNDFLLTLNLNYRN